jgi:hypothetical protein
LSESKFRVLGKCIAAILVPCLLAATVYYASFVNINSIFPKPAYAFVWFHGSPTQADADYANATLLSYDLGMDFGLKNGTMIHIHDPMDDSPQYPSYNGSIKSLLDNAAVFLTWGMYLAGTQHVSGGVNITTGGATLSYPIADVTMFENTTISSVLAASSITDMGSYTIHMGPKIFEASNTPGYWPNASKVTTNSPTWAISATELSEFLEGTGNATIQFDASFSVHVDYSITFSDNSTETGEKLLTWNGTMGTIAIKYDETGIFEAQYEWKPIELDLLALKNPP